MFTPQERELLISGAPNAPPVLFARVLWEEGDYIEIRLLPLKSTLQDRPSSMWRRVSNLKFDREWLLDMNEAGYGIYAGVLPRLGKGQRGKNGVRPGRVVWLDVDNAAPEHVVEILRRHTGQAGALPPPTLVLGSGAGTHLYWRFSGLVAPAAIERLNKSIVQCARHVLKLQGADANCSDRARIMRVPGYINHKRGRASHIHAFDRTAYYSPNGWESWLRTVEPLLPPIPAPKPKKVTSATAPRRHDGERAVSTDRMTGIARAQRYLAATPGCDEGERNPTGYRLACFCLCDCGLSGEDVVALLATWDRRNRPPLVETDGPGVLSGLVANAMKYARDGTPVS